MKNCFLLQNEFENWLNLHTETLCFKPYFYCTQVSKLNNLPIFNGKERSLSEVLETEIRCDNSVGAEEILLKVLSKMEENGMEKNLKISHKELEGLRIGLLEYRIFLHHFIAMRGLNDKNTSNYLSEIKPFVLTVLFNDNLVYSLPVYQSIYTHNQSEVDDLWQKILINNSLTENENAKEQSKADFSIATILVKHLNEKKIEVIDGGNRLITIFILMHVLNEFSSEVIHEQIPKFSRKLSLKTQLNEQRLFRILINHGINKNATTPNEISKGIVYKCEEPSLNSGFHFLQTTFRFVQLLQESRIPQAENHISDLDAFKDSILKNNTIKRKLLTTENNDKTYLTNNAILIENLMEWI